MQQQSQYSVMQNSYRTGPTPQNTTQEFAAYLPQQVLNGYHAGSHHGGGAQASIEPLTNKFFRRGVSGDHHNMASSHHQAPQQYSHRLPNRRGPPNAARYPTPQEILLQAMREKT